MAYDNDLQQAGLCGHICETDGPFKTFHCTRPADHILDGEPIHQAIQMSGAIAGRVNGAWHHDGTAAMEPVDMTPVVVCGLEQPLPPDISERANQRLKAVGDRVDLMVLEYQASNTDNPTRDMLKHCKSLAASLTEQASDPREGLELACELAAVCIRKLAESSWERQMLTGGGAS